MDINISGIKTIVLLVVLFVGTGIAMHKDLMGILLDRKLKKALDNDTDQQVTDSTEEGSEGRDNH